MAAVKGKKGARKAAAPKPKPPSRLAAMRRIGDASAAFATERTDFRALFGSAALLVGASVAGAAWIGGDLVEAREAFAAAADRTAATAGLKVAHVEIDGVVGMRAQEVRAAALPADRASVISADPQAVRARVESLDWVEAAEVRRLWPNTLSIQVERRRAAALWRIDGRLSVVDPAGEPIFGADPAQFAGLPVIEGEGAPAAAWPLLDALAHSPALERRVEALVRVGGRRWDVRLSNGTVLSLPEVGAEQALVRFGQVAAARGLLDRPSAAIDLRDPGRAAVSPSARQAKGTSEGARA